MGILMEMRHYGVRRTHGRNIKLCEGICVLLFESCTVMGSGQISFLREYSAWFCLKIIYTCTYVD